MESREWGQTIQDSLPGTLYGKEQPELQGTVGGSPYIHILDSLISPIKEEVVMKQPKAKGYIRICPAKLMFCK